MHQEFLLQEVLLELHWQKELIILHYRLIILHLLRAKCNLLDHKFYLSEK